MEPNYQVNYHCGLRSLAAYKTDVGLFSSVISLRTRRKRLKRKSNDQLYSRYIR